MLFYVLGGALAVSLECLDVSLEESCIQELSWGDT